MDLERSSMEGETPADGCQTVDSANLAGGRRAGAPVGNQNARKNGLRSLAATGRVPTTIKGGLYIRRQTRKLRREAHQAFVSLHEREPGVHEHIVLKVMARAEARAMLHERILSEQWQELSFEQRAMALDKIGSAGDQLIRCSRELGLNQIGKNQDDPWKSIPASVIPPLDEVRA